MPWTKACNWNESNLNPFSRNNWRASLVPAAAVIPAPIVYFKVVAVKKLVVGFQSSFKRISGLLCQFVMQCVLVFLLFFLVILTTRSSLPKGFELLLWLDLRRWWFSLYVRLSRSPDKTFACSLHWERVILSHSVVLRDDAVGEFCWFITVFAIESAAMRDWLWWWCGQQNSCPFTLNKLECSKQAVAKVNTPWIC